MPRPVPRCTQKRRHYVNFRHRLVVSPYGIRRTDGSWRALPPRCSSRVERPGQRHRPPCTIADAHFTLLKLFGIAEVFLPYAKAVHHHLPAHVPLVLFYHAHDLIPRHWRIRQHFQCLRFQAEMKPVGVLPCRSPIEAASAQALWGISSSPQRPPFILGQQP